MCTSALEAIPKVSNAPGEDSRRRRERTRGNGRLRKQAEEEEARRTGWDLGNEQLPSSPASPRNYFYPTY